MGYVCMRDRATGIERHADISECGNYRWWLRRSLPDGDGRVACFVMLNPSTADAMIDDPTIRRCIGFVRSWGYSTLSVRNLFPYRCTDPAGLKTAAVDPTGGCRGDLELYAALTADLVVCAWGAGHLNGRNKKALEMFGDAPLFCLGTTKEGHPRHPLYVRGDAPLIPLNPR